MKGHCLFIFFLFLKILLLCSNFSVFALDNLEYQIGDSGISLISPTPFNLNPAHTIEPSLKVKFISHRIQKGYSYEQDQNDNITKIDTDSNHNLFAAGLLSDLGSGLGISLNHQIISILDKTKSAGRSNFLEETIRTNLTQFKLQIELIEHFFLGLILARNASKYEIIGSFSLRKQDATLFSTSLLGTGAGIFYKQGQMAFAAAYMQPQKGKSLIDKEEKIISEPGSINLSFAFDAGAYNLGFSHTRIRYKEDDRAEGTQISNADRTQINLFGLNKERNEIFPLEIFKIDYAAPYNSQLSCLIGLSSIKSEFVSDLSRSQPGENKDPKTYNHITLHLKGIYQFSEWQLSFLTTYALNKKYSFEKNSSTRVDYKGRTQSYVVGINTAL